MEEEIRKAFEMWSEVSGLTFTRKTDWRKANIILGFAVRLSLWVEGKGVGVKKRITTDGADLIHVFMVNTINLEQESNVAHN